MKQVCSLNALALMLVLQVPTLAAQEPAPSVADAEPAPASRAMVSLGLGNQALAQTYPDQARWLKTEAQGEVLVMFEKEQAAQPRGAVLILADEGQSANTQLARALRPPLTRAGWAAMAMGLPELPLPLALAQARRLREASPVPAADQPEADPAGDEVEAVSDSAQASSVMIDVMDDDNLDSLASSYEARVLAGLDAALAELRTLGYQRVVLVAVGRAAELATRQALAAGAGVQELVWIAPTLAAEAERALAAELEASPVPLLELSSSRTEGEDARERAALMRRQGVAGYSQQAVAMASRPVAHNAGQLANRILAWLAR